MWEHSLFVLYCIVLHCIEDEIQDHTRFLDDDDDGLDGLRVSGIGRGVGVYLNRYKQPITHTGGTQRLLPSLSTLHYQRTLQPTFDYLRHTSLPMTCEDQSVGVACHSSPCCTVIRCSFSISCIESSDFLWPLSGGE